MFFDPIQQAALQVYYSVPYAPKRVQLRTTYQRELTNKFTITSGLDDLWSPCVRSVLTGNSVTSLAISASGCLFASAGGTPGVQMWDSLTGRIVGHFIGRATSSSCPVMFSPSGDYVAVGCDTGAMDIWDVATGQQLLDPDQGTHQASVTVLAFSWNSSFIASGSTDATVHIWDISTRSLRHSLAYHQGPIRCLLFSFNDSLIASGSDDRLVITSNAKSGQLVRRMQGHSAKINSISFSTDNSSIASGSDDQAVRLWDIRTGVCLQTYTGSHKKPVTHVWISADNKHLVSVCDMGIYMWQLGSRKSPQHIWAADHFYRKMAIMLPAWYAKLVKLFPSKMFGRFVEMDDGTPLCPVFSPNGNVLGFIYSSFCFSLDYSVMTQGRSKIRNLLTSSPTLDETPLLPGELSEPFTAIAMAPDSTQLITFSGGAIQIWNTTLPRISWKDIKDNMRKSVEGFWPTPDGRSLLVKPFAALWLLTSAGTLIKELETGGVNLSKVGASVSPDSQYYAYWAEYTWNVDRSYSIHIYETTTGDRLKRFPGLFKIERVTFSADSKFVACGHGDGIIQVWELPSGLCKATIDTGHAAITSLTFIPGNIALVAGSEEGHVEYGWWRTGTFSTKSNVRRPKSRRLQQPRNRLWLLLDMQTVPCISGTRQQPK
jgi:WD40 repeat protein